MGPDQLHGTLVLNFLVDVRCWSDQLMEIDQSLFDGLVSRPSESLNVEIKRWINPDEPEGIEKIVKAALAIRNRNGGSFLVGFDDKTLMPDTGHAPADVRDDIILLSR